MRLFIKLWDNQKENILNNEAESVVEQTASKNLNLPKNPMEL
jgi:hypothetical protein